MEPKNQYIIDSLQKQSDFITGFVVLQSLALSYKLGDLNFLEKVRTNQELLFIALILHAAILFGAVTILYFEGRKIKSHMDNEIRITLKPMTAAIIRCFMVLSFGCFPLMILLKILQNC